jgi:hypothetical protein
VQQTPFAICIVGDRKRINKMNKKTLTTKMIKITSTTHQKSISHRPAKHQQHVFKNIINLFKNTSYINNSTTQHHNRSTSPDYGWTGRPTPPHEWDEMVIYT